MTMTDVSDLAARLDRLERQQRRYRRFAWGALGLLPLVLGAFVGGGPGPLVRAEQVELLNAAGGRQAVLSADSSGVTLTLFGARGKPVSGLQLGDSALTLLDADGQPVATLGGPRVRHLGE
ncbi:MAG TPA: hypothetical protein VJQ44_13985 [Gemmatimonadales bacterium]|nr:hypothetical protein [Gemmatimonadales bacterium]